MCSIHRSKILLLEEYLTYLNRHFKGHYEMEYNSVIECLLIMQGSVFSPVYDQTKKIKMDITQSSLDT